MIPEIVELGLASLGYNFNTPKTLYKDTRSPFEKWCGRIAPYVIFVGIILILVLILYCFLRYGGAWFGTEANHYQNIETVICKIEV